MDIKGLGNLRPNTQRTDGSRSSSRSDAAKGSGAEAASSDRLETTSAQNIDRSVAKARKTFEERIEAARQARERLLALTSDPAAIRRAARNLLGRSPRQPDGPTDPQPKEMPMRARKIYMQAQAKAEATLAARKRAAQSEADAAFAARQRAAHADAKAEATIAARKRAADAEKPEN